MTDLVGWIGDFFTISFGTIGTTDITLGLMVSFSLVASLVLGIYHRVRSR